MIHKRSTQIIEEVMNLNYVDRLEMLVLFSSEQKKLQGDSMEAFKFMKDQQVRKHLWGEWCFELWPFFKVGIAQSFPINQLSPIYSSLEEGSWPKKSCMLKAFFTNVSTCVAHYSELCTCTLSFLCSAMLPRPLRGRSCLGLFFPNCKNSHLSELNFPQPTYPADHNPTVIVDNHLVGAIKKKKTLTWRGMLQFLHLQVTDDLALL